MIKIIQANALNLPIFSKSVHCIVTSPPYFGLRDYGPNQEIDWPASVYSPCTGAPACIEVPAMRCGFGSESTIEAYIWHSLLILRECRRVLRDDGVLWWNLGDSYAGTPNGRTGEGEARALSGPNFHGGKAHLNQRRVIADTGLPQGNLIGIPARLFLAAQADGWIVRNDCTWAKSSAMPESVTGIRWVQHRIKVEGQKIFNESKQDKTSRRHSGFNERYHNDNGKAQYIDCPGCDECSPNDGLVKKQGSWRHTRAQESVFMLTKQMQYFCDGDAVREKQAQSSIERANYGWHGRTDDGSNGARTGSSFKAMAGSDELMKTIPKDGMRNPRSVLTVDPEQEIAATLDAYEFELRAAIAQNRNPLDVLRPKPSNYSGQHFAVFAPDLIRNLIKSSTPKKCCPECSAGYAPVVEIERKPRGDAFGKKEVGEHDHGQAGSDYFESTSQIKGYRPTCECNAGAPVPGIVLDPFVGSGTTCKVAGELGVSAIGIDISFPYLWEQATHRAEKRVPREIMERRIEELPLFSTPEPFERLVLDGTNGKSELKTEKI